MPQGKAHRWSTDQLGQISKLRTQGLNWENIGARFGLSKDAMRLSFAHAVRMIEQDTLQISHIGGSEARCRPKLGHCPVVERAA